MLTLKKLQEMEPDKIFDSGISIIEEDGDLIEITWVAIRGRIHDWAIYYTREIVTGPAPTSSGTLAALASRGSKVKDYNLVRHLVDCDSGALNMYRL